MDYSMYVAKTFMVAFTKIGPVVAFMVVGYFVFIKLPFLFFRNSLRAGREYDVGLKPPPDEYKDGYSVNDYNNFLRRQSRLESKPEEKKENKEFKESKQSNEGPKQSQQQERRQKERTKAPPPPPRPDRPGVSPEEAIFRFEAGQRFTKNELKKRYRDLLKQSHPDMVATEGTQVRKMADLKSKEINSAYEKLKAKAA